MSTTTEIATLQLSGTKKGNVVSIGIALNGKDIEWKSHIPYGSLDDVIEVLQKVSQEKKAQNA
jgi:hypothetical protein